MTRGERHVREDSTLHAALARAEILEHQQEGYRAHLEGATPSTCPYSLEKEEEVAKQGMRRTGTGLWAVRQVVAQHPGPWQVAFQDNNLPAVHFWRWVAEEVSGNDWTQEKRAVPGRPELLPDVWISFESYGNETSD